MLLIRKVILIFSIFISLVAGQNLRYAETSQMEGIYFEIAQKKIKELGMDETNMDCCDKSAEWKTFLKKRNDESRSTDLYRRLTGKDFVAIYCGPKDHDVLGGDITIFINRNTNEIIYVLRGQ